MKKGSRLKKHQDFGYDISPDHIPIDPALVARIAPFVRKFTWESAAEFSATARGLLHLDPDQFGLCHIINAVGARALQILIADDERFQLRVEPVVGRWPMVDEMGTIQGVASWGENALISSGKFHAAIACRDGSAVYSEDGVIMMPTAYIDFSIGDVVKIPTGRPNCSYLVKGEVFCSWDNKGLERNFPALYLPTKDYLTSGPHLSKILEQDHDEIERCAKRVIATVEAAARVSATEDRIRVTEVAENGPASPRDGLVFRLLRLLGIR